MVMNQIVVIYNVLASMLVVVGLILLWRLNPKRQVWAVVASAITLVIITFLGAFASPVDVFGNIQLFTWAVFIHYPLFLIGVVAISFKRERRLSQISGLVAICILLVGLDAFVLEPHWIEVSRVTILSRKLHQAVRVAVIADLQTDQLGAYEARAFELIAAEQPDLILLSGDYLHIWEDAEYLAAKRELNALLRDAQLEAKR